MTTHARRRAGLVAAVAFIGLGAGFTCDHPTEAELAAADGGSAAAVSGHPVQGQVTARGASLAGVAVKLAKSGANYTAMTDAEGQFAFGAVSPGTYGLSARAVGVKGLPADVNITSMGTVEVSSEAVVTVDAPTHELSLAITVGGSPLEGARVHCTMPISAAIGDGRVAEGLQVMKGYSGEDGVFRSALLPKSGTSTCYVFPLDNSWRERFLVRDVNRDIEVSLDLPGVRYAGALTAAGKAVAKQTVKLAGAMNGKSATAEDGSFAIGLAPGWYSLAISGSDAGGLLPAEYSLAGGAAEGGALRNVSSAVTEDLDLPVHVLTLKVTGVGGAPVEGAVVDQVVKGTSFPLGGWQIANGTYAVRGTSNAKGEIRLPLFPRSEGIEIAVSPPEGSTLLEGAVALEDVSEDATLSVSLAPANQAPVADAGGPYVVEEGSAVRLDGSRSSDADGDKLSFAWQLPDGSVVEGAAAEARFADGPAEHTAVLTVTDASGLSSSAEARIKVINVAPAVAAGGEARIFSAGPRTVVSGESFELQASFADPGEDDWSWHIDWGTGLMSEGGASAPGEIVAQSPVYTGSGERVVRIVVQDDDGDSGEAEIAVEVVRRPVGLDILPGSSENPFPMKARGGSLPVAVLSDDGFDATALNITSIGLGNGHAPGVSVSRRGNGYQESFEDVNGDGLLDLMLHFDRDQLKHHVTSESTQLVLRGLLPGGAEVEGVDAIRPK